MPEARLDKARKAYDEPLRLVLTESRETPTITALYLGGVCMVTITRTPQALEPSENDLWAI